MIFLISVTVMTLGSAIGLVIHTCHLFGKRPACRFFCGKRCLSCRRNALKAAGLEVHVSVCGRSICIIEA